MIKFHFLYCTSVISLTWSGICLWRHWLCWVARHDLCRGRWWRKSNMPFDALINVLDASLHCFLRSLSKANESLPLPISEEHEVVWLLVCFVKIAYTNTKKYKSLSSKNLQKSETENSNTQSQRIQIASLIYWNTQLLHKTTKGTIRVPEISHLQAGNHSNLNEKEKITSVRKHVDDHNTTGIAKVSICDRFRSCSRDSSGGRTKQLGVSTN